MHRSRSGSPAVEDDAVAAAMDAGLSDDPETALEAFRERVGRYAELAEPMLEPDEIERLANDRVQPLAGDLAAIATAYNLATAPILPDLAHDEVDSWVDPTVELRLIQARPLRRAAYDRLLDQVDDEAGRGQRVTRRVRGTGSRRWKGYRAGDASGEENVSQLSQWPMAG